MPDWEFVPPSWSTLRHINLLVAALCVGFAVIADNRWVVMLDSFAAGALLSSWVWIGYAIRMQAAVDLLAALNEMSRVINDNDRKNADLIAHE